MAIDDNTTYGLTGAQIKDLAGRIPTVTDGLTSTSTTDALSAKQGKILNENKLAVANLLAGTGVSVTTAGSGANQTVTISSSGGSNVDFATDAEILEILTEEESE